jgi:hypothetical protein
MMNDIGIGTGQQNAAGTGGILSCSTIDLSVEQRWAIVNAALNLAPVAGLTHNFYRYPARFSPLFARSVIEAFSEPGDWIFDPFMGGGTTLVEAMSLGRNAVGIDISSLSAFVCEAKTTLLSNQAENSFRAWQQRLPTMINMQGPTVAFYAYAARGYYRNLEGSRFWRLRKAIEQCLGSLANVQNRKAQTLARCVILRTAQWALDSRRHTPTIKQFREKLEQLATEMLAAAMLFRDRLGAWDALRVPQVKILNRPAEGIEKESAIKRLPTPKLILTSPPYPGIHVLYHRWQVDGRKEASAPFWIANKLDGAGTSFYTMGDRRNRGLRTYFEKLRANFLSIARVAGPETTIVQMVAFSEREWQLPEYLRTLAECGLEEVFPWPTEAVDGRLWRTVPNRKWHAQQRSKSPGAQEVVLVHRLANAQST